MDEDNTSLSVKSFIKKIDERIVSLTDRLIVSISASDDNILRGKILAFKEAKVILLNKKS